MNQQFISAAALRGADDPDQVLTDFYRQATPELLAKSYSAVAKGLAVFEEMPRGNLATALRGHLNIIVAEQQRRGEAAQ